MERDDIVDLQMNIDPNLKNDTVLEMGQNKFTYEELKEIWKCNEKIANENFERFKNMNLQGSLTPAIFS